MLICPWCRYETKRNQKRICTNCDKTIKEYIEINDYQKLYIAGESYKDKKLCINCGNAVTKYTLYKSKKLKQDDFNKFMQFIFLLINVVIIFGNNSRKYREIIKIKIPVCDECKPKIEPIFFHPFERLAYFIIKKNG